MSKPLLWTIIAVAITLGIELVMGILKRYYASKLAQLLMSGQFEEFDKLVDKKLVRYLVPPFNLDYMKLNEAIAAGDDKKTAELLESFRNKRLNSEQQKAVYTHGFSFYMTKGNGDKARYYLDELGKLNVDEKDMKTMKKLYAILIEKDKKLLERTVEETERLEGEERISNLMLLVQVYASLDDKENTEKYLAMLRKEETDK